MGKPLRVKYIYMQFYENMTKKFKGFNFELWS